MGKIISISPQKSGSNILRRVLDLEEKPGIKVRAPKHFRYHELSDNADAEYLWGHVHYFPQTHAEIRRQDRKIWLLVRDPRDIVVSFWHFQLRIGKDCSYVQSLDFTSLHMNKIRPWEDVEVEIFHFEELILDPEGQAKRISSLLERPEEDVLADLLFRGGMSYREGGGIGSYQKDFPDDLYPAYWERCADLKHWEWNAPGA